MTPSGNGKPMNGKATAPGGRSDAHRKGVSSEGASSEGTPREGADAASARTRARASGYTAPQPESDRQPAAERENAFNFLAWLLDGATGVVEELKHNDLGLSEEFWTHAYAARTETLLAMRAALDTLIEKSSALEREEAERHARQERRGGIDIEF